MTTFQYGSGPGTISVPVAGLANEPNDQGVYPGYGWLFLRDLWRTFSTGYPNLYERQSTYQQRDWPFYTMKTRITMLYPGYPALDQYERSPAFEGTHVEEDAQPVYAQAPDLQIIPYTGGARYTDTWVDSNGNRQYGHGFATTTSYQITLDFDDSGFRQDGDPAMRDWTFIAATTNAIPQDTLRHVGLRIMTSAATVQGDPANWRLLGPKFRNSPAACQPADHRSNTSVPKINDYGLAPSLRLKIYDKNGGPGFDGVEDQNTLQYAQYTDRNGVVAQNHPLKVLTEDGWVTVLRMKPYKALINYDAAKKDSYHGEWFPTVEAYLYGVGRTPLPPGEN